MPPKPTYISGGSVTQQGRSKWRLSYIPEFIWGLLNQITNFFSTLIGGSASPRRVNSQSGGRRLAGFDSGGNISGGGGVSGGGPTKGPDNGPNNRRGDMKNILACNAASGS
ncbi:hypothetical protein RB653_007369 [Dictyostelium firmibasis]|uniref:Selenoprotein K n=1 Tax=Dictyostelium firmibasis TaxID=79012 RepID=A0AAN7U3K4_9MYCE